MMLLLPLLTTTQVGFNGSLMKKHWSTWLASTHGSFFVEAFFDLASGITMVVKYRPSFSTFLVHMTWNIGTVSQSSSHISSILPKNLSLTVASSSTKDSIVTP